ncbi:MAG: hypothetical protein IH586_12220 [Anaerolineaceae bacterium]|nr:hypothetical protein [Anaerolineaceae bacterium]
MLPEKKKSNTCLILAVIGAGLATMICICVGAVLVINAGSFSKPSPTSTSQSLSLDEALAQETSDDRLELIARLGWPDSFTITIQTIEGVEVRCETWRYYQYATRVDFVDGEIAWTMEIDPAPEGAIFPAWYYPLDFENGMSPADAARMAAISAPTGEETQTIDLSSAGEDLQDAVIMAGDQILMGFQEGRLVYVETMALFPEEGE